MRNYISFAVFGAGLIGAPIARELRARGASVVVFARPGRCPVKVKQSMPAGVDVHEVDYNDAGEVTRLLKMYAVEVVVSTMSSAEVALQNQLATTAQGAGVELFSPSEFGVVTEGCAPKTEEVSTMGFVAHVLTFLPPEKLFNRTFRLQGDRSTISDLAAIFGTEVEYVKQVPGRMSDLWTRMQSAAECGVGSTGWDMRLWAEGKEYAGCTNHLWKGHEWKTIKDFYRL